MKMLNQLFNFYGFIIPPLIVERMANKYKVGENIFH